MFFKSSFSPSYDHCCFEAYYRKENSHEIYYVPWHSIQDKYTYKKIPIEAITLRKQGKLTHYWPYDYHFLNTSPSQETVREALSRQTSIVWWPSRMGQKLIDMNSKKLIFFPDEHFYFGLPKHNREKISEYTTQILLLKIRFEGKEIDMVEPSYQYYSLEHCQQDNPKYDCKESSCIEFRYNSQSIEVANLNNSIELRHINREDPESRGERTSIASQHLTTESIDSEYQFFNNTTNQVFARMYVAVREDKGKFELHAIIRDEEGYVEVFPENRADEKLTCQIGRLSLPFSVCKERFWVKGLFKKLLQGDTSYRHKKPLPWLAPSATAAPLPSPSASGAR